MRCCGASYATLFAVSDRSGTLSERISRADQSLRQCLSMNSANLILCTQALAWRFPALQERYAYHQKRLRDELELWLPEVAYLTESHGGKRSMPSRLLRCGIV